MQVADSGISIGISAGVLPSGVSDFLGPAAPALQIAVGAKTFGLGTLIAGASSYVVLPVALSGLAGVEIGSGINSLYEYFSGQPFGADLYDWLHSDNPCPIKK